MSIMTVYEGYKKRKRSPMLYGLHTFGDPGCPIFLSGPFRENIRSLLRECGEIENYNVEGMPTWCTLLLNENNGAVVPLYTIEESVNHCSRPFCDHCRCIGWSHHFVSKRRYHLIIPTENKWNKPLEASVFDVHTHILHGLIHCNGFGHLLSINGHEGGSKYLSGTQVMDLWDRICSALCAQKITVEDTSRKRLMDLRLIHGAAYGYSWFGRWGYKFCHGSFGVNEYNYEAAISLLSNLQLDKVVEDFSSPECNDRYIKQIVQIYRQASDTELITMRDLLRFMISVKSKAPVQRKTILAAAAIAPLKTPAKVTRQRKSSVKDKQINFSHFAVANAIRWPARRLLYAAQVIVDALKEEKRGMSRQEVRDAARLHIGDTGLLDFVIKSINNYVVGDYVVHRTISPSTRVLQFTIHEIGSPEPDTSSISESSPDNISPVEVGHSPGVDVHSDMDYLYQNVLESYPSSDMVELAIQVVMDSKHFVKEWPFVDKDDEILRFMCHILPSTEEMAMELTRPLPPGVLVVVPPYTTMGELKLEAEIAFRDTYCLLENYSVREVLGGDNVDDDEVVFGTVESGTDIWVRGTGIDIECKLKYEGGVDNWIVECSCGAKDDDGERMVACDFCEVWQHTRCGGIGDSENVPALFLCSRCNSSLMPEAVAAEFDMSIGYQ